MSTSDEDARYRADLARLKAAKGIQLRAWLAENKTLLLVLGAYVVTIAAFAGYFRMRGESVHTGILFGAVLGPILLVRMYRRHQRYKRYTER